jgi:predicted ATP-dependent Lon-type protease
MSDFVQTANVRRSVRNLTTKIADVAALKTLVQGVIDTNAFLCMNHFVTGETYPGVSRGRLSFGFRVVYENPTTLKNMRKKDINMEIFRYVKLRVEIRSSKKIAL